MIISYTNTFSVANGSGSGAWPPSISGLTPMQAQIIDSKLDDGFPGSGTVNAHSSSNIIGYFPDAVVRDGDATDAPTLPVAAGQYCSYIPAGSSQWLYNAGDQAASCALRFRASF